MATYIFDGALPSSLSSSSSSESSSEPNDFFRGGIVSRARDREEQTGRVIALVASGAHTFLPFHKRAAGTTPPEVTWQHGTPLQCVYSVAIAFPYVTQRHGGERGPPSGRVTAIPAGKRGQIFLNAQPSGRQAPAEHAPSLSAGRRRASQSRSSRCTRAAARLFKCASQY